MAYNQSSETGNGATAPAQERESGFKRLVRSLSRSRSSKDTNGSTGNNGTGAKQRSTSNTMPVPVAAGPNAARTPSPAQDFPPRTTSRKTAAPPQGTDLSTSPPPDSYFPQPPHGTLSDGEANGRARHPDSLGARANDIGGVQSGMSAPGVTFAPQGAAYTSTNRKTSDTEEWNPAPRRSQSQRANNKGPPVSSQNPGRLNRARTNSGGAASNGSEGQGYVNGAVPLYEQSLPAGERKGVTLEDKPLTRSTSVKRAASAIKRAAAQTFAPLEKQEGEKRVLILMADGSEEMETVIAYDIFVRASLTPTLVSVSPQFSPSQSLPYVTLSRGAKMIADTQFETLKPEHKDDFDAVIIPGGAKGAERLSKDKGVQQLIRQFYDQGKLVGMICAGSLAAKTSGIAEGEKITSHPSVKAELEKHYRYSEERVVVSRNLVTSRGPGTAMEWALQIVAMLAGEAKRAEVAGPMIL
ncbi:hypothetical protein OIV83_005317 [Microbotryomycetes sp. JL201]|nr:hypothetical protein OIV83_005317 [Microbotryomycetes sp. JL201]